MNRRVGWLGPVAGWVLSLPLRLKILGIVLGVIFLLALVVTVQVRATLKGTMREELKRRGVSIARDVAGRVADLILTDNLFDANELVRNRLESDRDVRYLLVVGRSGEVLAHTFGQGVPPGLLTPRETAEEAEFSVEVLQTEEGLVWDVSVPILQGMLGTVRVGMSELRLQGLVRRTTGFLLLATAAVSGLGFAAAYLLTSVLTRPILDLVSVTESVAEGNLQQKATIWTRDEVGRLGTAFNAMTEALARSRGEIEEYNRQLRRRNEEIRQKELVRRRLLDQVIRAQEEERKRVARELHDQVGQSLTALIMRLGTAEEMIPAQREPVRRHLAEIRSLTSAILEEIRRLMLDLRPALLDDLGLVPAIQSYVETFLPPAGVEPHVDIAGTRRKLPAPIDITVFRVVQEAVTNIVRHAQASRANIQLAFHEGSVTASIEDNGKGFDPENPQREAKAFGLLGMEERAALFCGRFRVESRPGEGTRVVLELPIPQGIEPT